MMLGAQSGIRNPTAIWRQQLIRPGPAPLRRASQGRPIVINAVLQHPGRHEDAVLQHTARGTRAAPRPRKDTEAILCSLRKAHEASITSILVTNDQAGHKEVVSGSLDKTVALWRFPSDSEALAADASGSAEPGISACAAHAGVQEVVRLNPAGAPIFSLAVDGAGAAGLDRRASDERQQVFCGNAAKAVGVWDLPAAEMQERVVLNGHTGWVRALAAQGRWLFSAGCNVLRQWDLARAVPRHVRDVPLVKGDILGIATRPGSVYTCGADGSIRSWAIDKKGELTLGRAREKAHKDRVSAILAAEGFLYSVSWDGSVKMWDAQSMELVMEVPNAHEGGKVHCATVGPDGNLYTGGDDKMVRRWRLGSLNPAPADALYCHSHSVRALAAGPVDTLVSGDQSGELAFWKV